MPDAMKVPGQIETGPASSIKGGAVNMAKETKQEKATRLAESKLLKAPAGGVCYSTCGASDFQVEGIRFNGPRFATADVEEMRVLDSCVARKILKVIEDNRKVKTEEKGE